MKLNVKTPLRMYERKSRAVKGALSKANVTSLNKTAAHIKTHAGRKIAETKNLPVGKTKKRIVYKKAKGKLEIVKGLGLVLAMRAVDVGAGRQTKKGVVVRKKLYEHAFKAEMPNGKKGIMQRKGDKRLPIEHVKVYLMPEAKPILKGQIKYSHKTEYPKFLKKETKYRLGKMRRR